MTITECAKRAKITRPWLSNVVNGKKQITRLTAENLSPVLKKDWLEIIQMPPETLKKTIKEA